jgi:type IV secretion system protein VirB6
LWCSNVYAHDSVVKYEEFVAKNDGYPLPTPDIIKKCISEKIIYPWQVGELRNTYVPPVIYRDAPEIEGFPAEAGIMSNYGVIGRLQNAAGGPADWFSLVALMGGIQIPLMLDLCVNAYVLAPHEEINRSLNPPRMQCEVESGGTSATVSGTSGSFSTRVPGTVINKAPGAYTQYDIPFFYHCDPAHIPGQPKAIVSPDLYREGGRVPVDDIRHGHTWGYVDKDSHYCDGSRVTPEHVAMMKDQKLIGKIRVEAYHWIQRWLDTIEGKGRALCAEKPASTTLYAGEVKKVAPLEIELPVVGKIKPLGEINYYSYYRIHQGQAQQCVASLNTLMPLRIGCVPFAAPGSAGSVDPWILNAVAGTRCSAFITGRLDLESVGNNINILPYGSMEAESVRRFLTSELHILSTAMGCIQDMFRRVFVPPAINNSENSFFISLQDGIRNIVLAMMALYLVILGYTIMISGQPPQSNVIMVAIIKIALIAYLGVGEGLYKDPSGRRIGGDLIGTVLDMPNQLSDIFMQAMDIGDPVGMCRYQYNGANVLSNRQLSEGGLAPTPGFNEVRMSMWDMIDCKLLNYMNFGSCSYSVHDLMASSIIFATPYFVLTGGVNIFVIIVGLIYIIATVMLVFKLFYIMVVALASLALLLFLSPIFLAFWLFESTKNITQHWFQLLISYMLYPALMVMVIAIVLATFDSMLYGELNQSTGSIKERCRGVDTIFCKAVRAGDFEHPCAAKGQSSLRNMLTTFYGVQIMDREIGIWIWRDVDTIIDFFKAFSKLALFAILMYLFVEVVKDFLESFVEVQALQSTAGKFAKDKLGILADEFGGKIGNRVGKAAGKVAKGAVKSVQKTMRSAFSATDDVTNSLRQSRNDPDNPQNRDRSESDNGNRRSTSNPRDDDPPPSSPR